MTQETPNQELRPIPERRDRDLLALRNHLIEYATFLLAMHPLRSPIGQVLPEDAASTALMWALDHRQGPERRRRWDPAKCPLDVWCRGAIRSLISNARTSREGVLGREVGGDLSILFVSDDAPDAFRSLQWRQAYRNLLHRLRNDPVALVVLDALTDDPNASSPIIARLIGMQPPEVENARKRIKRHLQKVPGIDNDDF